MFTWHDQLFTWADSGSPHYCLDTELQGPGCQDCQGAGLAAMLPGGWTVMPGEGDSKGGSLEGAMALGGTVMVPTINIQEGEEVGRVTSNLAFIIMAIT